MMLLIIPNQTFEISWHPMTYKYYVKKGYEYLGANWGQKFTVTYEDLKPSSNLLVKCVCENCNKKFETERWKIRDHGAELCPLCRRIKTFKSHYGKIENPKGNQELADRKNQTHFERTGYKSVSADPNVQKARGDTYEKKTGFRNPFDNPEIQKQIQIKAIKTRSKNGTINTSKYQYHLHDILIDSKLNFPVDRTAIDIAFTSEMIGLEYNGTGHYFAYLCGYETLKEKKKKDIRRAYFLKSQGWKLIFIDHTNVKKEPFTDDNVIKIINFAKQHLLNTKHKWVRIDYDNNRIYGKGFELFTDDKGNILFGKDDI